MKTFKLLLLLLLLLSIKAISQSNYWDLSFRLTNGYIDKNPVFATQLISNYSTSPFEFLAFERWNNTNNCNICVLKITDTAPNDTMVYITNNNLINKSPSIAYSFNTLTRATICWESFVNGRWNLYGKTYNQGIWSAEYPIDTSAGDKQNCKVIFIDSSSALLFGIVYEKQGDIIFKRFNALSKLTIYESNLTSTDTAICRNPGVTKAFNPDNTYYVFYERQKSNGQFAIYYRKAASPYNWAAPDTFAFAGNNRNIKTISSYPQFEGFSFESDRSGKWGLYQTYWNYYYSRYEQSVIAQNNNSENRNLVNFLYPVIGKSANSLLGSYVSQGNDSTRINSGGGLPPSYMLNTFTVGDTTKKPVLAMGIGIPTIPYGLFRVWLVYNIDSAGYSMLYARGKKVAILGAIRLLESGTPDKFELFQNYPNPFNPVTKIKFDIPSDVKRKTSDVKLIIYDITGREIQTLVNEKLNPGTYEVTFDGSNYASGVYFYQLKVGEFIDTKKLVLLK
jgi:hypothetical protein